MTLSNMISRASGDPDMIDNVVPNPGPETSAVIPEDRAIAILEKVNSAVNWMSGLAQELEAAIREPKAKVSEMCEAYVLAKRVNDTLEEGRKLIGGVVQNTSYQYIPERMLEESMTTFTSASGYRVTVATRLTCSILPDMKAGAYAWLEANDLGELIVPTVNAQTLSSQARKLIEDENKEMPDDLFKVSTAPYTSVTKVKAKS